MPQGVTFFKLRYWIFFYGTNLVIEGLYDIRSIVLVFLLLLCLIFILFRPAHYFPIFFLLLPILQRKPFIDTVLI